MDKIDQQKKVTLYISEHNITKKKYFGKTTKYFTEKDLQKYYHGSGKYWKRHLRKHGKDLSIKILGIYSLDENDINYVEPFALKFSKENNIVESDEWANLLFENGLDGGTKGMKRSKEAIKKSADAHRGMKHSEESKQKMSKAQKGKKLTEEHKNKLCIPRTEESKQKQSESRTGKKLTPEHIAKISAGRTGMKFTKEHRNNLSKAAKLRGNK